MGFPMRWLILLMTLVAMLLCFTRHSGGAMAWWLFVGLIGVFGTALAFAQAKIDGNARSQSLSEFDLKRLREGGNPLDRD
jgi:hypothetical protein